MRDGEAYFAINRLEEKAKPAGDRDLFEIQFAEGIWMLARLDDLVAVVSGVGISRTYRRSGFSGRGHVGIESRGTALDAGEPSARHEVGGRRTLIGPRVHARLSRGLQATDFTEQAGRHRPHRAEARGRHRRVFRARVPET